MALPLESKIALVTGASKGIGRGIAIELARCGCDVTVNYNGDRAGAEATAAEIRALGRTAIVAQADVASAAETTRMFDEALAAFARLDILVNNAGTQVWKPLVDLEEAEWDRVIATNLKGCFLCTKVAARHMRQPVGGTPDNPGAGESSTSAPGAIRCRSPISPLTRPAKAASRCSPR
jgi:NAD(P)-dependent dehydrogenase (short-subunit alcohol dehydrogenase family)